MNVITTGVSVARGIGGRRGSERRRRYHAGAPCRVSAIENAYVDVGTCAPGKRERRRLAKRRRGARDRDVARLWVEPRSAGACPLIRAMVLDLIRYHGRPAPWWATAEGRRRWIRDRNAPEKS